jgi:hypothetical protein
VYERCLNEAEVILRVQQEPMMPVRRVWEEITKRSKLKGFEVASLSDFSAMLEGDSRFQIVPAQNKIQDSEEASQDAGIEETDMGQLGFFAEDRVKLRGKKLVEAVVSDEEEEVGSIRRKSFATQAAVIKKIQGKKPAGSKDSIPAARKKKTPGQKNKSNARSKSRKKVPIKAQKRRRP